jgi:DNA helicase-2/ATP-dependent DNA helicase PcrA
MKLKYSALDIARALRASGVDAHDPTPEQIAIIESMPLGPCVVIAGAGSGKTETMSARVLWLVANEIVKPEEILGLTFTRKAAGELAARIRLRLRQLRAVGALPVDSDSGQPIDIAVNVATYHSYAGKVLAEHSIRMGIDTDAQPIGEAAAWQIAHSIVTNFTETLYPLDSSADSIVGKVMDLSASMGEHGASIQSVREYCQQLLEDFGTLSGRSNVDVLEAIEVVKERLSILPMVEAYDAYRVEHGELTFSDQMSFAADLVNRFSDIGELERGKYKVILLDEYQDTSYSQVRFLSALFGNGHAVTAVGDPNQAIYGWRSASSETLLTFANHFVGNSGKQCQNFTLLTTWRNDENILELANRSIDEIAAHAGRSAKVDRLSLRTGAPKGELIALHCESMELEAKGIAEEFALRWNDPARLEKPPAKRSSFAVLVRNRKYIAQIEQALRERGLPVEVVGLGGLIHIPEVADIIALLRVLTFPDAGSSLMRLLTGPRLAIGTADIAALGEFTRKTFSNYQKSKSLADLLESGDAAILEADDFALGSAIEALELFERVELKNLSIPDYAPTFTLNEKKSRIPRESFTEEGFRRLVEFAHDLRELRRSTVGSLTDAILEAERYLFLDTEVLVRDGWDSGRKHLDNFLDEASKFARTGGTLSAFLQWLDAAESRESGLKPISIDVTNTAIQILTIHASKGSEWNVVAVPGLIKGNFPVRKKRSDLWIDNSGSLPIALRGDRSQLRDFTIPDAPAGKSPLFADTKKALKELSDYWEERRIEEELRLAYVAFTRAKQTLICSASWFGSGERPVDPSPFFAWANETAAAQAARLTHSAASAEEIEKHLLNLSKPDYLNPASENPASKIWPVHSDRAAKVRESAELVLASKKLDIASEIRKYESSSRNDASAHADSGAQSHPSAHSNSSATSTTSLELSLLLDAQSLIQEVARGRSGLQVELPRRLSVSTLQTLKDDPTNLALSIRRPLPRHIDISARRGTTFHSWIEEKFTAPKIIDDEFDDAMDYVHDLPLAELQEKWLASEWSTRTPVEIEVGFETMLGGRGGTLVRGRIDAIYPVLDSEGKQTGAFQVVDWKTGREKSGEDLATAAIQLAMYRLAYSKLKAIPLEKISAAFYYVGSDTTVRPADLLGESELIALIEQFPFQPTEQPKYLT